MLARVVALLSLPLLSSAWPLGAQARPAHITLSATDGLSRDQLITVSVLPLPEQLRAGAGVVTFDSTQRVLIKLRESRNGIICVRLHEAAWDARCYHESFAPIFFRARMLGAEQV